MFSTRWLCCWARPVFILSVSLICVPLRISNLKYVSAVYISHNYVSDIRLFDHFSFKVNTHLYSSSVRWNVYTFTTSFGYHSLSLGSLPNEPKTLLSLTTPHNYPWLHWNHAKHSRLLLNLEFLNNSSFLSGGLLRSQLYFYILYNCSFMSSGSTEESIL